MKRILKWLGLGILGLIGLFVVVGVMGAIVGGGGGSQPASGGGDQQQEEQAQKEAPKPEPKPQGPEDYLKITGTAQGASCSVLDDKNQRSVDTGIPGQIKLEVGTFGLASVGCQKSGDQGSMKLELYVDKNLEASGKTTAQYGLVNLTYPQ